MLSFYKLAKYQRYKALRKIVGEGRVLRESSSRVESRKRHVQAELENLDRTLNNTVSSGIPLYLLDEYLNKVPVYAENSVRLETESKRLLSEVERIESMSAAVSSQIDLFGEMERKQRLLEKFSLDQYQDDLIRDELRNRSS